LEIYENGEGEQLIELKQAITLCKVKMTKDSTKAHPQNPCKKMIVEKKSALSISEPMCAMVVRKWKKI
jgi:hypothetical protein